MQTVSSSFSELNIAPKLLEILDKKGFSSPTPIQKQSIPIALSGKDMIGIAQTGTGKTFAFGIPTIQRLGQNPGSKALILVPTRELAVQVNESLSVLGRPLGMKTVVVIGGESVHRQRKALGTNPHVIIATPGRLNDLLDQKAVNLEKVTTLILDEADRMLDMGFAPQLKRIAVHVPKERQTLLFSATMDDQIMGIANTFLKLPLRVEVAPAGTTATQVTQEIIFVEKDRKLELLEKVLGERNGSTLIFSRTKHGARKIAQHIKNAGHSSSEIHSDRSLNQRLEALNGFKMGKYRVLVATDIAARGIDVTNIAVVINYDLPQQTADYVHRIGRTARAGREGHAISFATPNEKSAVRSIERLINKSITTSQHGNAARSQGSRSDTPRSDSPRSGSRFGGSRGRSDSRASGSGFGSRFGGSRNRSESSRPRPEGSRSDSTAKKPWKKNDFGDRKSSPFSRNSGGKNKFGNRSKFRPDPAKGKPNRPKDRSWGDTFIKRAN